MSPESRSGARKLLLLRHGQTAWNLEGRVQGQLDIPLDETGLLQAEKVAPVIAGLRPGRIVSSDLARARTTAEKVAEAASLELRLDPRLREFDLGERSGTTLAEYAASHADEFALYRAGHYEVVPGGESREDVVGRFMPALAEALEATEPGGLTVVVAHGAAIKVSLVAWLGWPKEAVLSLHALGNCHWALLDDSGPVDASGDVRPRLVAYNHHV